MQVRLFMTGRVRGLPSQHQPDFIFGLAGGCSWLHTRWVRCAARQAAVGDLAHFAPRRRIEGSLASPFQRLVHVSRFQYPKTTNVLLGLQIWAIGDEHLAVGLATQRLRLTGWTE